MSYVVTTREEDCSCWPYAYGSPAGLPSSVYMYMREGVNTNACKCVCAMTTPFWSGNSIALWA